MGGFDESKHPRRRDGTFDTTGSFPTGFDDLEPVPSDTPGVATVTVAGRPIGLPASIRSLTDGIVSLGLRIDGAMPPEGAQRRGVLNDRLARLFDRTRPTVLEANLAAMAVAAVQSDHDTAEYANVIHDAVDRAHGIRSAADLTDLCSQIVSFDLQVAGEVDDRDVEAARRRMLADDTVGEVLDTPSDAPGRSFLVIGRRPSAR